MENDYIVGYSNDYRETEGARTFDCEPAIFDFISTMSAGRYFKVHRINQYSKGKLTPFKIEMYNGKMTLTKLEESK